MKTVSYAYNPEVMNMYIWTFAYKNSTEKFWEYFVVDRERTPRRVMETETVLTLKRDEEFWNKIDYSKFTF